MKTLAIKRPAAVKRPEGVVDVRKVKSAIGGEGPAHLTWVIAYSEQILPGSPGHEAIRAFAGTLKAPRNFEQSVMLLPVMAREAPAAEARPPAPPARAPARAPAKSRAKRPAKARIKLRARAAAKPRAKARVKSMVKAAVKSRARTRAKAGAKSNARKPARKPARGRFAATTSGARSRPSA